jgi:transcription elongation factor Elf1
MQGFETALGLADEPPPVRRGRVADLRCARCGGASRLETLDLRTSRGLAACGSCGQRWSILYGD